MIDREQLVIHLEARLEGEAIHRRDVGKKRKLERGLCCEISSHFEKLIARNYDCSFAPGFNYFGDGWRVPFLELAHGGYFVDFLWH